MITIGAYSFEGPFTSTDMLRRQSGVYVILTKGAGNWKVIDVGESENVQDRVAGHDRKGEWQNCNQGTIAVACYYTTVDGRMAIERTLRQQFNPTCGVR